MALRVRLERSVPFPTHQPVLPDGVGVLSFAPIVDTAADGKNMPDSGALLICECRRFFVAPGAAVERWVKLDQPLA